MKHLHAIRLIACFVLLVVNNDVTEGHNLKNFFSGLRKNFKSLQYGILPGNICFLLVNHKKMNRK